MAFAIYEPYGGFHQLKSLQVMGLASMVEPFTDEYLKIMEHKKIPVEAMKKLPMPMNLIRILVNMSMYGGFEQVGPLGQSISRDDKQITTEFGDIVLYSGNQIVVFYGSNSWAYTKLGHIDLSEEELTQLLGNGDVVLEIK